MSFGYPGSNSQLENHNVSEESFWPSFTDIMMVIVMVFLLVTVAVILNNWTLISKLTTSIEAQKAATSLADNRQVQNITLENELGFAKQNLLALNKQFEKEQKALEQTQLKLSTAAKELTVKEQSLSSIENKLSALAEKFRAEQLRLNSTSQQLTASEEKLSTTDKQLLETKQELANKNTIIESLEKKLLSVETQRNEFENNLDLTSTELEETKDSLNFVTNNLEQTKTSLEFVTNNLAKTESKLALEINSLEETKSDLAIKITDLSQLQETLDTTEKQKEELVLLTENQKTEISQLKSDVDEKLKITMALQTDRSSMDQRLTQLQDSISLTQEALDSNIKESELQALKLQEDLSSAQVKLRMQEIALKEKDANSEGSLDKYEKLLLEAEQQLLEKEQAIKKLTEENKAGNTQLLSLKGEFDTLDSKYQKLLRPARSSKDKYVASVTYKKVGGKRVIRFKPGPSSSYRTVNKDELENALSALKAKHKTDLYVKVVIPQNSGLSYNEAWKFTINLQRKYDYYYND